MDKRDESGERDESGTNRLDEYIERLWRRGREEPGGPSRLDAMIEWNRQLRREEDRAEELHEAELEAKGKRSVEDVDTIGHEDEIEDEKREEPPKLRARRLGIRDVVVLERRDKIERNHVKNGLTQAQMAEVEGVSIDTIKRDFKKMKQHPEEYPLTCKVYT